MHPQLLLTQIFILLLLLFRHITITINIENLEEKIDTETNQQKTTTTKRLLKEKSLSKEH